MCVSSEKHSKELGIFSQDIAFCNNNNINENNEKNNYMAKIAKEINK